jgi:drug/metabolite transporter (DMT)-like permease
VGLQPLLTSTIANRLLGERVAARQWVGLILGLFGIYLVVQDKATTGGTTLLAWVAAIVALISITFGTIYQKRFGGGIDCGPACLFNTQHRLRRAVFICSVHLAPSPKTCIFTQLDIHPVIMPKRKPDL